MTTYEERQKKEKMDMLTNSIVEFIETYRDYFKSIPTSERINQIIIANNIADELSTEMFASKKNPFKIIHPERDKIVRLANGINKLRYDLNIYWSDSIGIRNGYIIGVCGNWILDRIPEYKTLIK